MPTIQSIVQSIQFPSRDQYKDHVQAYDMLKRAWFNFKGPVRNLQHFRVAVLVKQLDNQQPWYFCAEYWQGLFELKWLTPEQLAQQPDLLPLPKTSWRDRVRKR